MGRVFCSIVADTSGWHDTVCGNTTKAAVASKWGEASYQKHRNDWHQNGHDSFLIELAKYGLGRRDLAANVNWFSKVVAADDGSLILDESAAKAGALVELRFEMDTLVLLHTCPHPSSAAAELSPQARPLRDLRRPAGIRRRCLPPVAPENGRGFENTRIYQLGCCA